MSLLTYNSKVCNYNNKLCNYQLSEFLPETIAFMSSATISYDSTIYGTLTGKKLWYFLDEHIKDLKGIGRINNTYDFWNKYIALYPFIGGTAASHKYNLKNPEDSNSAFRIIWTGTSSTASSAITHSFSGVQGGAFAYAHTFVIPNSSLNRNNTSIFRYANLKLLDEYEMGIFETNSGLYIRATATSNPVDNAVNCTFINIPSTRSHFLLSNRVDSSSFTQYNDTTNNAVSRVSGGLSSRFFPLLALNDNGSISNYAKKTRLGYVGIGSGCTSDEVSVLKNIITQFQKNLNRK